MRNGRPFVQGRKSSLLNSRFDYSEKKANSVFRPLVINIHNRRDKIIAFRKGRL